VLRDAGTKLDTSNTCSLPGSGEVTTEFVKARPEIRIKRWAGECDLGFRFPISETLLQTGDVVQWGNGNILAKAYILDPTRGLEDGGLEFEVVLASRPQSNKFSFNVDGAENYDWFLQPALTAQQIAQGRVRPDNVVGSYAVYHKAKRNHVTGLMNYGTGKAFHVYRPKLIDADGVETWGTLEYSNGTLTVSIPQQALNSARYPAIVDPTFGYTSIGASNFAISQALWMHIGTPASSGTVDSVSMHCDAASGNIKGVIALASTKVIVANGVTPSTANSASTGWKTCTYVSSPSVTASTDYYAGWIADANIALYYDTGGTTGQDLYDDTNDFTTPTDPATGGIVNNEHPSVYATYTAAGGKVTKNTRSNPLGVEVGMGWRIN
jgi:hypothetical protein